MNPPPIDESGAPTATALAGYSGLLSVGLGIAAFLLDRMWSFPGTAASASEIAAYVTRHETALSAAMIMNALAVSLWLVFGAGVWLGLRGEQPTRGFLATTFGLALVSSLTLLLAGFLCFFVVLYRAPADTGARLLYELAFGLLAMSGPPTALALSAFVISVARHATFPRGAAFLAAFAAAAHLALLCSLVVPGGFFSLAGGAVIAVPATLFAWIGATSYVMARS
jgi:hypothetical protein